MTKAQTLYAKANEAAVNAPPNLAGRELYEYKLKTFDAQGFDAADFDLWLGHFGNFHGTFQAHAMTKLPSEQTAAKGVS